LVILLHVLSIVLLHVRRVVHIHPAKKESKEGLCT
jgi:hypothetical protein